MSKDGKGKVYLVGAGCGEADLITLRGLRLLQSCDVVVYDDLIAQELLDAAPAGAERLYMGKRSGKHSAAQEEISSVLVEKAAEGKTVVRLKGGDPFVFGRGGEEIMALQASGIPYDEVPGISSAIAIPAAAGIPVTHRGLSRSVHIVTAHTADTADGLPAYFDRLAQLPGTLVFLMGFSRLNQIARRLMAAGMEGTTPAAVISGGNSPNPAVVRGVLENIGEKTAQAGMKPPAVIVVGAVAALDLSPTIRLPLAGKRIHITGTAAVADKLKTSLSALGAKVRQADVSLVKELETDFDYSSLCSEEKKLIVFTSANGVRLFFKALAERRIDLRRLSACRFAVIGEATGKVLAGYGVYADICPGVFTSWSLAEAIIEQWDGGPVLIFRSAQGSELLYDRLSSRFPVRDIHSYTVVSGETAEPGSAPDYVTFSSAGGVRLYMDRWGGIPEGAVPVCIGEVTQDELRMHYSGRMLTAKVCTVEGIVDAILKDALS